MRRTATLGFVVAVVLAPPPAPTAGQTAPAGTVELVPSGAGRASRLEIDADPRTGAPEREAPRSVAIAIARGLRIDPRSRARRCLDEQARDFACPKSSKIGQGHVEVTVSGYLMPGGSYDSISSIDAFLAPRSRRDDVAGIVLEVQELVSGRRSSVRGRIVRVARRRIGAELRFDELPGGRAPAGLAAEVKRLRLTVQASRKVKRRRRGAVRKVRDHLLRNPRRCVRSWPYELRVGFAGRTERRRGRVACR